MPSLHDAYPEIRRAMIARLNLPPAPSPSDRGTGDFGSLVMAWLGRTLSDKSAENVWESLTAAGLDSPDELAGADLREIVEATRGRKGSAKPITPKVAQVIQRLAHWVAKRGGLDALGPIGTEEIREELRSIPGLGAAGVDAILLHGMGRATYPVDRASYRILARHGWIDSSTDYEEARSTLEGLAQDDGPEMADLAAGFAEVGRKFCRVSIPKCQECPLKEWLPEGGPYEMDSESS